MCCSHTLLDTLPLSLSPSSLSLSLFLFLSFPLLPLSLAHSLFSSLSLSLSLSLDALVLNSAHAPDNIRECPSTRYVSIVLSESTSLDLTTSRSLDSTASSVLPVFCCIMITDAFGSPELRASVCTCVVHNLVEGD